MKPSFTFHVSWGEWSLYVADKYHPEYDFSGYVETDNGIIRSVERMIFPRATMGPYLYSNRFSPMEETEWNSKIRRWFDGVRITSEVNDDDEIRVYTKSASISFTPGELKHRHQIIIPVGDKYSMAQMIVEIPDTEWLQAPLEKNEYRIMGSDFDGPQGDNFQARGVVVPISESSKACFNMTIPKKEKETDCLSVRAYVRFMILGSPTEQERAVGLCHFQLHLNGQEIYRNKEFSTYHDWIAQYLDEVEFSFPVSILRDGENVLEIRNLDKELHVMVQMVRIIPEVHHHMEITSCPQWTVVGEVYRIGVLCSVGAASLKLTYDDSIFEPAMACTDLPVRRQFQPGQANYIPDIAEYLWEGEREFFFRVKRPFQNAVITFEDLWTGEKGEATIEEGWSAVPNHITGRIGVEIQTGTPHDYHLMVQKIVREQLGNLAVFRDYSNRYTSNEALWEAAAECRKYGIWTDSIQVRDQNIIAAASAEHCQCVGDHECTGIFYSYFGFCGDFDDHRDDFVCHTMRDAQTAAINTLRSTVALYKIPGVPVATGDASGGSREAYMAGFDIIRHETFVGHSQLLLPSARGCAKAFHKNYWGTHVATAHNYQPEMDAGMRRFWLGFAHPWVSGSGFIYEEDSLFRGIKYVRAVGNDFLTRRKKELNAQFFKYSQTHQRQGHPKVDVAVLQGRYAPPINGLSTSSSEVYQPEDENFPVWGLLGADDWTWGYRQPEKGYHLLEHLSPGIFLHPLNQDSTKVRKIFSGDPKGEFDFLPVEADSSSFMDYQLSLLLGWHTMERNTAQTTGEIRNDYDKFKEYAYNGGTLFMAVPHLTTRTDRDFLKDMDSNLYLYNSGNVEELCGVRVTGKSETAFSSAIGINDFEKADFSSQVKQIRIPNTNEEEDGSCMLAEVELTSTAEIVAVDRESNKPVLIRNRIGKGYIYLLCTWAYPGHERLRDFLPHILDLLMDRHVRRKVFVNDPSGDVYWSVWETAPGTGKIYLLNTDWSEASNEKTVTVHVGNCSFPFKVREGFVEEIIFTDDIAMNADDNGCLSHLEQQGHILLTGVNDVGLRIWTGRDIKVQLNDENLMLPAVTAFNRTISLSDYGNEMTIQVG